MCSNRQYFTIFKIILTFIFSLLIHANLFSQTTSQQVFINEFCASNSATICDPDYQEYSDWIEIYNAAESSIQIGGYYLTDDLNTPKKWKIAENTNIRPGWRLLFWADGKDEGRHINFKLSKDGGQIGIFSTEGVLLDTISYQIQTPNISYGRYPDGVNNWYFFNDPTPGTSNDTQGYKGLSPSPGFSIEGGFYTETQTLELTSPLTSVIVRYTTDGSIPNSGSLIYNSPISINSSALFNIDPSPVPVISTFDFARIIFSFSTRS